MLAPEIELFPVGREFCESRFERSGELFRRKERFGVVLENEDPLVSLGVGSLDQPPVGEEAPPRAGAARLPLLRDVFGGAVDRREPFDLAE